MNETRLIFFLKMSPTPGEKNKRLPHEVGCRVEDSLQHHPLPPGKGLGHVLLSCSSFVPLTHHTAHRAVTAPHCGNAVQLGNRTLSR